MRWSVARHGVSVALLFTLAVPLAPIVATHAQVRGAVEDDISAEQRLAGQLIRAARYLLTINPLSVEAVDGVVVMIEEASTLDPDNPETWRVALQVATLAERDDLKRRALERLVALDPADEIARLQWISLDLERHQTVEQRVAAYESWLTPERRRTIGPAIASRLALDLALLERRRGNVGAFTEWLAEAVTLDPANRAAAAIAAGYFRINVDDPYAEAELLVALFLAGPTDVAQQAVLGAHLLNYGAYHGAARLYSLTVDSYGAAGRRPPSDLVADLAIARWGRGDLPGAMQAVRTHQAELDRLHRRRLREENPDLTAVDRAREHAPMTPTLATVAAALQPLIGQSTNEFAISRVIDAYQRRVALIEETDDVPPARREEDIASTQLELAWVILWLNGDAEVARSALEAATERQPISEAARARFDGWLALRTGDLDAAVELLEPHAVNDPVARLGLAVAREERGRKRDAARDYLAVARSHAGTLMGVWAADRLASLLGQRVPLDGVARQLEALIEQIHPSIDRFPNDPISAVSIRVTPTKPTFGPYEPIIVNIEISNNSLIPLAIDRQGPIRPEIVLLPSVQISREGRSGLPQPIIVSIERRLRLMPRERLVVSVDLRRTHVGSMLESSPTPGAMVSVRAILNFMATPQRSIIAGLLGSSHESSLIRVDGVRVSQGWIEDTLANLSRVGETPDLTAMALLSQLAAAGPTQRTTREQWELITGARTSLAERFARLTPAAQAWLLTVIPNVDALEAVHDIARKSEHRLVRIAQLIFRVSRAGDPMLDAAARSEDPALRKLAVVMRDILERAGAGEEAPLTPPLNPPSGEFNPAGGSEG